MNNEMSHQLLDYKVSLQQETEKRRKSEINYLYIISNKYFRQV